MGSLHTISLESNRQIKINIDGGDLFFDAGHLSDYQCILCYDGLTGDLLKAELSDGTQYCSKDATDIPLYLQGDSGFAALELYTFIVTTLEMEPYQVIRFYCGRGKMEKFIKEGKVVLTLLLSTIVTHMGNT